MSRDGANPESRAQGEATDHASKVGIDDGKSRRAVCWSHARGVDVVAAASRHRDHVARRPLYTSKSPYRRDEMFPARRTRKLRTDEAEQRRKFRAVALARWEGEGGAVGRPPEESERSKTFDHADIASRSLLASSLDQDAVTVTTEGSSKN
jgi:hypothetical protein